MQQKRQHTTKKLKPAKEETIVRSIKSQKKRTNTLSRKMNKDGRVQRVKIDESSQMGNE